MKHTLFAFSSLLILNLIVTFNAVSQTPRASTSVPTAIPTKSPAPVRTCPCDGKREAGDGLPTTASAITYSKVNSGTYAYSSPALKQAAEGLMKGPSFREYCSYVASSSPASMTTAGFPKEQCANTLAAAAKYKIELLIRCAANPGTGSWLVREKDGLEELTGYLCSQVPGVVSCNLYLSANNPNACCLDAMRINGTDVPIDPKIGKPSSQSAYACCPRSTEPDYLSKKCSDSSGGYSCCRQEEGCKNGYCVNQTPTPIPSRSSTVKP